MTIRAKRLAKYLEDELGWEVFTKSNICKACSITYHRSDAKYCFSSGGKLTSNVEDNKGTLQDIETAIKYCLGENR